MSNKRFGLFPNWIVHCKDRVSATNVCLHFTWNIQFIYMYGPGSLLRRPPFHSPETRSPQMSFKLPLFAFIFRHWMNRSPSVSFGILFYFIIKHYYYYYYSSVSLSNKRLQTTNGVCSCRLLFYCCMWVCVHTIEMCCIVRCAYTLWVREQTSLVKRLLPLPMPTWCRVICLVPSIPRSRLDRTIVWASHLDLWAHLSSHTFRLIHVRHSWLVWSLINGMERFQSVLGPVDHDNQPTNRPTDRRSLVWFILSVL